MLFYEQLNKRILLACFLHCQPKWVVTTQKTWVINWVDSLRHPTYLIGYILLNSFTQNCQQHLKKTKVGYYNSLLRPNCGSREFKIYITSFLAPITTVLDCSLFAFLASADWYVKLLDSYIKQQMMNNFSFVAFMQIRHFGSLIANIFSIYKFVFLLINEYMIWKTSQVKKTSFEKVKKNFLYFCVMIA